MQKVISDVSSTRCTESVLPREFYLTAPDPISIFLFSLLFTVMLKYNAEKKSRFLFVHTIAYSKQYTMKYRNRILLKS